MATADSLYTTFQNTSGAARFFGYLGHHGVTLAADETFTVFGHPSQFFGRTSMAERKRASMETDLLAGDIAILSTPASVVQNPDSDPAVAEPTTQATVSVTGGGASGGSLAAGKYKVAYTFTNEWGETTVGTSASTEFTVVAGNIPQVTLPVLPAYADAINVYLTATGVSASDITTLRLYSSGIVSTSFNMSAALPSLDGTHPAPPTENTTLGHSARALVASNDSPVFDDPSWVS